MYRTGFVKQESLEDLKDIKVSLHIKHASKKL